MEVVMEELDTVPRSWRSRPSPLIDVIEARLSAIRLRKLALVKLGMLQEGPRRTTTEDQTPNAILGVGGYRKDRHRDLVVVALASGKTMTIPDGAIRDGVRLA
jgi:hypothetical protein